MKAQRRPNQDTIMTIILPEVNHQSYNSSLWPHENHNGASSLEVLQLVGCCIVEAYIGHRVSREPKCLAD